jgi:hypothetical protein
LELIDFIPTNNTKYDLNQTETGGDFFFHQLSVRVPVDYVLQSNFAAFTYFTRRFDQNIWFFFIRKYLCVVPIIIHIYI